MSIGIAPLVGDEVGLVEDPVPLDVLGGEELDDWEDD